MAPRDHSPAYQSPAEEEIYNKLRQAVRR
jgi:hypothetical protein